MVSNRNLFFQGSIFRGYVSFREGIPTEIGDIITVLWHHQIAARHRRSLTKIRGKCMKVSMLKHWSQSSKMNPDDKTQHNPHVGNKHNPNISDTIITIQMNHGCANVCQGGDHDISPKIHLNPSKSHLVGGFDPFEKYYSNWKTSQGRGENKKYLKPPPSHVPTSKFKLPIHLIN